MYRARMTGRAASLSLILGWIGVTAATGVFLSMWCDHDCGDAGGRPAVGLMLLATAGAVWGAVNLLRFMPSSRRIRAGIMAAAAFALILGTWFWVVFLL